MANDIGKLILEEFRKAFFDKKMIDEIAEEAVITIRNRTRAGRGISGNGTEKLKPLSEPYVKHRKKFKGLSSKTTPKKSNLTYTGEMLDDLTYKYLKNDKVFKEVEISIYEAYSKKKAQWVTEGGRPFLGLSDNEKRFITRKLVKKVEERLNKNLQKFANKIFEL